MNKKLDSFQFLVEIWSFWLNLVAQKLKILQTARLQSQKIERTEFLPLERLGGKWVMAKVWLGYG